MVLDKMGFQISDPIWNPDYLQPKLIWVVFQIPTVLVITKAGFRDQGSNLALSSPGFNLKQTNNLVETVAMNYTVKIWNSD